MQMDKQRSIFRSGAHQAIAALRPAPQVNSVALMEQNFHKKTPAVKPNRWRFLFHAIYS
jgi:hypothetical protein